MTAKFAASKCALALVVFFVGVLVCVPPVLAQTSTTGAIIGTVTDPSGAVISGAAVTLTNAGTGQSRDTKTDSTGLYKFSLLPPGNYSVKFSAAGFKTAEATSITVNVTETAVVNHSLEVGGQTQQVTVEATTVTVQTENATVGGLVSAKAITDLPLSTRNYTQIINLAPGVVVNVASAGLLGNGTQDINVNGSGSDQNNYMMDGATLTNYGSGGGAQSGNYPGIGIPNPDAIQEFKIQTAQYDASFGQNPGANVNVVTKSGTNQFHGAAWEFNRNNFFNANDYFLKQTQKAEGLGNHPPTLKQNQFGGTLGGPIKKDKAFFFGSYQGTRQLNGVGTNGFSTGKTSVPLLPFNDPACPSDPRHLSNPTCGGQTYAQYLGSVFGGQFGLLQAPFDTIAPDGSNINSQAIAILQAKTNQGVNPYNQGFYVPSAASCPNGFCTIVDPVIANEDQYIGNTDWVLNSKNTLTQKFFYSKDPQTQSFVCLGPCMPGAPEQANYSSWTGLLKLTTVATANFVNEARFSYQREVTDSHDVVPVKACAVGIIPMINNGTPCVNGQSVATKYNEFTLAPVFQSVGLPDHCVAPGGATVAPPCGPGTPNPQNTAVPTYGPYSVGGNFFAADSNVFNYFQPSDQISWNHGKHALRAGFEYNRIQWNWTLQGPGRGDLLFANLADFMTSGAVPFFGGILANLTTRLAPNNANIHYLRVNEFDFYAQDDIKVTKSLTVNLGLRWEYNGFPTDAFKMFTNFWAPLAAANNTGSFFLNNPAGTLAGFLVQSNYNPNVPRCGATFDQPCGLSTPGGATGVAFNSNKTLMIGAPLDNFAPRFGLAWQPKNRLVVRAGYGVFYDRIYGNLLGNNQQALAPYAGSFPAGTGNLASPWIAGQLGWVPRTAQIVPIAGAPAGAYTVFDRNSPPGAFLGTGLTNNSTSDAPNMGTPLVQEYNLDLQYEIAKGWLADVGYVGSHGTHLYDWSRPVNIARLIDCGAPSTTCNPPAANDIQNQRMIVPTSEFPWNDPGNTNPALYNVGAAGLDSGNAMARVPLLGLAPNGDALTSTVGDHLYDSLQAQLRHTFSHGLLLQASYTWSKLLTNINASNSGGGIAAPGNVLSGGAGSNDPLNLAQQYGLAAFNRSQRFVVSYSYDLPFKAEGWANKVVGGWAISGVTTFQNGIPFTVVDSAGGLYYGSTTAPFGASGARAELDSPGACNQYGVCRSTIPYATPGSNKQRLDGWINAAAFTSAPTFGGYPNPNWAAGDPASGCNGTDTGAGGTPIAQFLRCGTGWGNSAIGVIQGPGQDNWDMAILKTTKATERLNVQFRTEFFNIWNHAMFNPPVGNNRSAGGFGVITTTSVPGRVVQFGIKLLF